MLGFVDNSGSWRDKVLKPAVTNMLDSMGQAVVQRARELVPVDTGQLRDSLGYTVRQDDMTVSIHADKSYSWFVEFGTRHMKARPFLRPALQAARNWKNRGVNAELHFGGAGSGVRDVGRETVKPKGFRQRVAAAFAKTPKVVRHHSTNKSMSFRGARG